MKKNEYPWLVALVKNGGLKPYCGGALISSNTVLTSAQCRYPIGFFKAHVREHDVTNSDGEIKIEAAEFDYEYIEYEYDYIQYYDIQNIGPFGYDYDLAIIRLEEHVIFSSAVSPICLPNPDHSYMGRKGLLAGWGSLSNGSRPDVPHDVELDIISNTKCIDTQVYRPQDVPDSMFCAGPDKSFSWSDKGGPLMAYEGGGRYFFNSWISLLELQFHCIRTIFSS